MDLHEQIRQIVLNNKGSHEITDKIIELLTVKDEGARAIALERKDQIERFGFTGEHHAKHPEFYNENQLIDAACMLASYNKDNEFTYMHRQKNMMPDNWNLEWWQKMIDKPLKERLEIAGAMIAAEWDRRRALGEF